MKTVWIERLADGECAEKLEWGPDYYAWAPQYAFILRRCQPKRLYEWGTGIWTAMALASGARVMTVEHDPQWARPYTGLPHQVYLRMSDSRTYSDIVPGPYDAFLVNGIRVPECLESVLHTMDRDSFVVVRNPYVDEVRRVLALYPYVITLGRGLAFAALTKMVFTKVEKKLDTTQV
jgi:hypothetical protein